jgi:hypothetical protein
MTKTQKYEGSEWVLFGAIAIPMCAIFLGKIISPLLIFGWLLIGLKASSKIADHVTIGDSKVKSAMGLAIFFGVLAVLVLVSLFV